MRAPKIGTVHEHRYRVDRSHTVDMSRDDVPAVLSTPALVYFLEWTALELLLAYLEPEEITLGVHVQIDHLSATPVGMELVCRTRVIHVEGPVVTFQVEAEDERDLVGRGLHKRRAVKAKKFAAKVIAKKA